MNSRKLGRNIQMLQHVKPPLSTPCPNQLPWMPILHNTARGGENNITSWIFNLTKRKFLSDRRGTWKTLGTERQPVVMDPIWLTVIGDPSAVWMEKGIDESNWLKEWDVMWWDAPESKIQEEEDRWWRTKHTCIRSRHGSGTCRQRSNRRTKSLLELLRNHRLNHLGGDTSRSSRLINVWC